MRPLHALLCIGAIASSINAASTSSRLSLSPIAPVKPIQHCPINQVYKECKGCELRCEDIAAFRICPSICIPGCTCADGYVKNPDGKCVRQEDCPDPYKPFPELPLAPSPETCSDTEEFKQCKGCDRTCDNLKGPIKCSRICLQGCACKEGYVRNDEGRCIRPLQCKIYGPIPIFNPDIIPIAIDPPYPYPEPPKPVKDDTCDSPVTNSNACPVNEEFSACLPCNEQCPGFGSLACPYICRSGCACKPGFSRSPGGGKCIPTIQCPQIDPMPRPYPPYPQPPQVASIGPFPQPPLPTPYPQPPQVDNTCDTPVPADNTCPFNEEYTTCGGCEETCSSLNTPMACAAVCIVGCQCKKGYVRDNGICISSHQCPLIDPVPPYPYPQPPYVDPVPLYPYPQPPYVDPVPPYPYPQPPYVDPVPPYPYPQPPKVDSTCDTAVGQTGICPVGEVFTDCLPCNQYCPGFGTEFCPRSCISGCSCKPGYSRSEGSGRCIPSIDCPQIDPPYPEPPLIDPLYPEPPQIYPLYPEPPQIYPLYPEPPQVDEECDDEPAGQANTCPANEVFVDCLPCNDGCPGFGNKYCPLQCTSGCTCKPGYSRMEDNGRCIRTFQCPQIDPPYPEPPHVDELGGDGPVDQTNICPANEVLVDCKPCNDQCPGFGPQICTLQCITGCTCKPGYSRMEGGGACIPSLQCPQIDPPYPEPPYVDETDGDGPVDQTNTCPANEVFSTCKPCNDQCPGFGPQICTLQCTSGCTCKPGYSRMEGGGRCIPSLQCPQIDPPYPGPPHIDETPVKPVDKSKKCPANEVFSNCKPCSDECPGFGRKYCPFMCTSGCICKPGYSRMESGGKCIPSLQCPQIDPTYPEPPPQFSPPVDSSLQTCGVNEHYTTCGGCEETCQSLTEPLMCAAVCVVGCQCLPGYVRENGKCIEPSQCSIKKPIVSSPPSEKISVWNGPFTGNVNKPLTCPVNEEFRQCKGCDETCKSLNSPLMCPMICIPGCACKAGFVRKDGACVEPSKCPAAYPIPPVNVYSIPPVGDFKSSSEPVYIIPDNFHFGPSDLVYTLPADYDFGPDDHIYTLPDGVDLGLSDQVSTLSSQI